MIYMSWLGLSFAIVALVCLGISGPGHRLGFWRFEVGIALVKLAAVAGLTAVGASLLAMVFAVVDHLPGGTIPALIGLAVGSFISILTLQWKYKLARVPYIHDITTDTRNPPLFVAVLPRRGAASNSADYGGAIVAKQQQAGYPDLGPGLLRISPDATFPRALQIAIDMGWEIVASDSKARWIEATDTTRWFGFKDDVVVRISATPTGSRIDVRSASRVGKSDVGTNARRIQEFLNRLTRPIVHVAVGKSSRKENRKLTARR